ncbi:MAG: protein kinase, partial [Planctomycetes bacterium]|nr:protein kinase [Planctomycetota bacterium]
MRTAPERPHWTELEECVEAFEDAYVQEDQAEIAGFLLGLEHPLYLDALRELVRVDLEYGWARGRGRRLEEYQDQFPELFRDPECLQQIAYEEYRVRQRAGERPTHAEYRDRFGVSTADWPCEVPAIGEPAECAADPSQTHSAGARHNGRPADWSNRVRARWEATAPEARPGRADPGDEEPPAPPTAETLGSLDVGTDFGGFRLIRQLGSGAFARVFLAQQRDLAGRLVVLKITSEITIESQALSRLQHTHVVPIYTIHRSGPLRAICMPYFGSTTLVDVLRELKTHASMPHSAKDLLSTVEDRRDAARDKTVPCPESEPRPCTERPVQPSSEPVPSSPASRATDVFEVFQGLSYVEGVLWMAARLADGLAHAHERGILHRDLKPANILLTDEGQPMLLDFNLAWDTAVRSGASTALIGGTLPYMAPEHLDAFRGGRRPVDARSDLFSLGVILYELLAGRQPFPIHRGSVEDVLSRMSEDRMQRSPPVRCWNRAVSPAVEAIIRRCLEPDPQRRYQTARQLQEDLQRQLQNLPLKHAREPSLVERSRKWVRRHPRLTSVTSVALLALMGLLVVALAWSVRGRQLDRLVATDSLGRFQEEVRTLQFLLNTPDPDRDQLDERITSTRNCLAQYRVLDDPAWDSGPLVSSLADADRQQLRAEIGELLVQVARCVAQRANGNTHAAGREQDVQLALRLNALAESCYSADEVPRAVWGQRADLVQLAGDDVQARRLRSRADEVGLRTANDYFLLATEQVSQGRFREALPLLREANRRDPRNLAVWLLLGHCHAGLAHFSDAAACYGTCTGLWPKAHWPYYHCGLAHLDQATASADRSAYELARADFDKAIELQPSHVDSYINRGLARMGAEDFAGAVADFTRALERGTPYTRV